jgi:putative ABC transport system permease protein
MPKTSMPKTSIKIVDLLEETLSAVSSNKTRSGLTMLGIVIGIASVIAMVAIGTGAQSSIEASISSLGANLLTVQPGAPRTFGSTVNSGRGNAQTLTKEDANSLVSLSGVKSVSPESTNREQIVSGTSNTNTSVIGAVSAYPEVHNMSVAQGQWFSDSQFSSYAKVAIIGPTVQSDLFSGVSTSTVIGQSIRINGLPFTIIGITASKGGNGFNNTDNNVYIPLSTAQQFITGSIYVGSISIEATSQSVMSTVTDEVTTTLLARHKISDPTSADFNIINQADIASTASSVTGTFTALLAAVAGISLVVGGIGIMNMMLTTVTERTREIGLRKAIGAQRTDITMQFLAEAIVLTVLGGIIGIILGWLASWGVTRFFSITTQVSLNSILLAFGVSAGIGILFGYYPALRASKLNPIEALRYE